MSTNPHSPLNDSHLSQINNGLEVIKQAEAQLQLAKLAGIDVTQQEKAIADSKAKLLQLKRVYFPASM